MTFINKNYLLLDSINIINKAYPEREIEDRLFIFNQIARNNKLNIEIYQKLNNIATKRNNDEFLCWVRYKDYSNNLSDLLHFYIYELSHGNDRNWNKLNKQIIKTFNNIEVSYINKEKTVKFIEEKEIADKICKIKKIHYDTITTKKIQLGANLILKNQYNRIRNEDIKFTFNNYNFIVINKKFPILILQEINNQYGPIQLQKELLYEHLYGMYVEYQSKQQPCDWYD